MSDPCDSLPGHLADICRGTKPHRRRAEFVAAWERAGQVPAGTHEALGLGRLPSRGLGDKIAAVFEATGVAKVVKSVLGKKCGCAKRRDVLNRLFPRKRQAPDAGGSPPESGEP